MALDFPRGEQWNGWQLDEEDFCLSYPVNVVDQLVERFGPGERLRCKPCPLL